MSRGDYIYVAQHKEHREDLMYAFVSATKYELAQQLQGIEENYWLYAFSPYRGPKVFTFNDRDRRYNKP